MFIDIIYEYDGYNGLLVPNSIKTLVLSLLTVRASNVARSHVNMNA